MFCNAKMLNIIKILWLIDDDYLGEITLGKGMK